MPPTQILNLRRVPPTDPPLVGLQKGLDHRDHPRDVINPELLVVVPPDDLVADEAVAAGAGVAVDGLN